MNSIDLREETDRLQGIHGVLDGVGISGRAAREVSHRWILLITLGLPLTLVAASFVWLAIDRGTPLLWNVLVHESGEYTLSQTIFYFTHFLREVPIDVAYALFLAVCFARSGYGYVGQPVLHPGRVTVTIWAAAVAVTALFVVAILAAATSDGLESALLDLLQYRTRDDLVEYGSHWHFHWLSTIWFGAMAIIVSSTLARFGPREPDALRERVRRLQWLPWIYVFVLTLVFGLSSDTFVDIRYAGHQAREIITHGPITGLFSVGCLLLYKSATMNIELRDEPVAQPRQAGRIYNGIAYAFFISIPLFLAWVSLSGDVMAAGQSERGLASMVAGHVFEHVLDYVFVPLLTIGIYGLIALPSIRETRSNG